MKIRCGKCNSEWQSNIAVEKCPFCGNELRIKNGINENVTDCLKYLIKNFGIVILSDKKRLLALSCDLLSKNDDLRLLKIVVNSGVFSRFVEVEPGDYPIEIKKAIDVLSNNFFLSNESSYKAMMWIADALNVDLRNSDIMLLQTTQHSNEAVNSFERQRKSDSISNVQGDQIRQTVDICGTHLASINADKSVSVISLSRYSNQPFERKYLDAVQISVGDGFTVVLKSTGRVVLLGGKESTRCQVSSWTNITQVSASRGIIIGLKADGHVLSNLDYRGYRDNWAKEIETWENIKQVCAGIGCIAGVKEDNTIVFVSEGNITHPDYLSFSRITKIDYYTELAAISREGKLFIENNRKIREYCSDFYIDVAVGYQFVIALNSSNKVSLFGQEINPELENEINNKGEVVQVKANEQKLICKYKDGSLIFGNIYDNHLFYENGLEVDL